MLININSGFIHNQQKILAIFFHILQLCTRLPSSYDSGLGPFCSKLQLCTWLPSSYDSDLGPFCSRQLRGLPSSDGYLCILMSTSNFWWPNIWQKYFWIRQKWSEQGILSPFMGAACLNCMPHHLIGHFDWCIFVQWNHTQNLERSKILKNLVKVVTRDIHADIQALLGAMAFTSFSRKYSI